MDVFVYLLFWISLFAWAVSLVSRHVESAGLKLALYLLIVVAPFVGAGIASAIAFAMARRKPTDSTDRMFDAVVEAHRQARHATSA